MSVEEERSALIELEVAQGLSFAELSQRQKDLQKTLAEVEAMEKAQQERRRQIHEARTRLAAAEKQEIALEQAGEVSEEVARLRKRYRRRAAGKAWYEGTGNEDEILPFQWEAVMFGAAARRWICGDGIGLGKTRESIGWLDLVGAKKVLIVCEPNICNQFAGEVMNLAPHRTMFNLYKKTKATRHEMIDTILSIDEAVVIVNFEIWRKDKDFLAKLMEWHIDTLIVDEAHNLKSTSTANFKYIEMLVKVDNICPSCRGHLKGLYDPAKKPRLVPRPCPSCGWKKGDPTGETFNYPLDELLNTRSIKNLCFTTGTPILNDPVDLFALLHLCDPILFNTKRSFLKAFCTTNYHSGKTEFRDGGLDNLRPLIAGRFLARTTKEAGIVLPKQRVHIVRVDLDKNAYPKQYRTIKQISEAAAIVLDSGEKMTIMHLIALITRKRQANVWAGGIKVIHPETGEVLFDAGTEVQESVKLDVAEERILQLHAEGHRQVVFSQFTTGIDEFARRLTAAGLRVAVFTGDTPETLREEIKQNFYRDLGQEPRWDIVLCNYKAGGTGINLTAATCTHVIDEEWNPGKRDQSYGRTNRIGQTEESDVYVYRIPASIDTWMSNVIHRKETLIKEFNGVMAAPTVSEQVEDLKRAMITGEVL